MFGAAIRPALTAYPPAQARPAITKTVIDDQAAAVQGQANDFIKNQPAAALGIAAGLGFLVGLISSRK